MIQIPLVEETLGADYSNKILNFEIDQLSCLVVDSKPYNSFGSEYPVCAYIHLKGNDVRFRARYKDVEKFILKAREQV